MSSDQISLYFGLLDSIDTRQAKAACLGTLSSAEKQRAARFAFERHRQQFIFARGLLRMALSSFAPQVSPSEWIFVANHYGRPYIAAPMIAQKLYFSLSHSEGCVACAISGCESIGVDVEEVRVRQSLFNIARSNFSREEIDSLRALRWSDAVGRFYDIWTLKEAYLKARGTGLNQPLNQFSIQISPDQPVSIRFSPGISDDSKRWHFMRSSPSARHTLAVADGSGLADGLPIVVQPWPLT